MKILAYVKHEMSTDKYIWQVFTVPDDTSNIITYLASRGYATEKHYELQPAEQRQPRTKRTIEPSGGQHLCEVWRRSVIKGHCA